MHHIHHNTSHVIILHHNTSNYIILHHNTSYYIILHHITSQFIILHHNASSSDVFIPVAIPNHSRLPWQPSLILLLETIHTVDSLNIYLH